MPGPALSLPSLTLTIAAVCLLAWRASAQTGGHNLAYITFDEKTLFIQGGGGGTGLAASNELFALDLTRSWNTSHPLCSPVLLVRTHPQRPQALSSTITFSRISQTLTTWDFIGSSAHATSYYLATEASVDLTGLPTAAMNMSDGVMVAIDPTTSHVYIPEAYSEGLLLDYDLTTKTSTSQPMPVKGGSAWTVYAFVWNEYRKSFFLWGGRTPSESPYFFEYKPRSVSPWTKLHSNGTAPQMLTGSCLVSAYGGTKMLLFGGHSSDLSTFSKSLFILDVPSMTWTQESDPDTSENRAGMACSVAGDNFIIWGGYRNAAKEKDEVGLAPLIYNIFSRSWTTTFVPGSHYSALQKRDLQGLAALESGTDKSESNNVAIIGSAAGGGALVVILLVAILVVCRRRRRQRQQGRIPKGKGSSQVRDAEKDSSPLDIDDDKDRFNNKEPVLPSASQMTKDAKSTNKASNKAPRKTHNNQSQTPYTSVRETRMLELESVMHRPSQSPHSIDPFPSPRSTISPSSTIYGVYAAPTLINPSEPIRSMSSTSKHYMKQLQDQSVIQQQDQVGGGNNSHRHTIITDEWGVPLGPNQFQHRPQDHSESTRSNGERTLTTVEQLEVLHEELFSLNAEMSRLQASLDR